MRHLAFVTVMLATMTFAADASAQSSEIVPDIVYGHKDGMALTFDVFKPQSPNGAGVLFMISGGWRSTWRDPMQAQRGYAPYLDAGLTVFAVRHGSSPRYNVAEAVDDVTLANRYIHAHAAEWGVDADRLGVTGGSAGGHLSLVLGNNGTDGDASADDPLLRVSDRLAAVVAYFPPVDLRPLRGPSERFPPSTIPRKTLTASPPSFKSAPTILRPSSFMAPPTPWSRSATVSGCMRPSKKPGSRPNSSSWKVPATGSAANRPHRPLRPA